MSTRSFRYSSMSLHTPKSMVASTDRDAWAFLEAATIYNTNQQRAIIRLVRDLKRTGLWSKMKAIYPFIGGTATTHKWNLKDPRDLDEACRITFTGGWTHNGNGITGNGTNSAGNCNRTPAQLISSDSGHISIYNRTNSTALYWDFSSYVVGTQFAHDIVLRYGTNNFEMLSYKYPENDLGGTNTSSLGLFINTRSSSSIHKGFRNTTQLSSTSTATSAGFASLTANYCIGQPAAGGTNVSNRNYAFATIGDGLTDTDATNLYNIVDLYQKRLGRAV